VLEFNEADHSYWVDGVRKHSVTQILSSVGVKKNDHWNSISGCEFAADDVAAQFGRAFHAVADFRLKGIDCEYDEAMEPWINQLDKFLEGKRFDILNSSGKDLVEVPMYSRIYDYCGTPDAIVLYKNEIVVLDWKTSTAFQDHWFVQVSAYVQLVREFADIAPWLPMTIVRFSSDSYDAFNVPARKTTEYFNKFLSILNVFKIVH
jgi:hypothetical protein